jgi:anti-sigma factor RsiW
MNCFDARTDIALLAGGDLDDASRKEDLRRHLAHCEECRREYKRMKASLKALSGADRPTTWISTGSLWPRIEERIAPPRRVTSKTWRRIRRLRHWTPLAAMTAACLLMVVAINQRGGPREEPMAGRSVLTTRPPTAMVERPEVKPESKRPEESRKAVGDQP